MARQASRAEALRQAALAIVSPAAHADDDAINAAFRLLRHAAPVHWIELDGIRPFWAVTRYADILAVEQHGGFLAAPRTILSSDFVEMGMRQISGQAQLVRPLTHMDDPDHHAYRAVAQPWFLSRSLRRLEPFLADLARKTVNAMMGGDRRDFAAEIAAPYSLKVIMALLGLPEGDLPVLLRLARGLLGAEDASRSMADLPLDAIRAAMTGFCDYFEQVAAHRRARPRDDLASAIANASVGGKPMPDFERVSYYILMATAGHDTTSFAIAGGLHALIEHPAQLARLKREPGLLGSAVEEMLRWTSPVRHFMRTAAQACELGGTRLRAGDAVCLFFNSANRDETVFANAEAFRIDRSPNPHIAFGRGAHLCLGHHLARMEMRALFAELLPRLDHVEAAGPTDRARSAFVTGIKSLTIRYRLRAAPDRR